MQIQYTIVILAFCAALTSATVHSRIVEHRFAKVLAESRAAFANNPATATECFDDYMAESADDSTVYQTAFDGCGTTKDASYKALDESFAAARTDLVSQSDGACQSFTDCNENERSLEFFQCYGVAGNDGATNTYLIGNQAEKLKTDVDQKAKVIDYESKNCEDNCRIDYEKALDQTFKKLQGCLVA